MSLTRVDFQSLCAQTKVFLPQYHVGKKIKIRAQLDLIAKFMLWPLHKFRQDLNFLKLTYSSLRRFAALNSLKTIRTSMKVDHSQELDKFEANEN